MSLTSALQQTKRAQHRTLRCAFSFGAGWDADSRCVSIIWRREWSGLETWDGGG